MTGLSNDNVQRRAITLNDSSDEDDETLEALRRTLGLFPSQEMESEQEHVRAADIETAEQVIAFSDMMRPLLSRNHLATVAATGDSSAIAQLLRNGHDVDYRDGTGETAIYVAAARGYAHAVTQLLHAGADPNLVEDVKRWSPLHAVCQAGNESMVALLLRNGARPNTRDNKSWTPLHVACLYGSVGCVRALIEGGADLHADDGEGRRPIHVAVDFGHEAVIRSLTEKGVLLDCPDSDGTTPLHLAVNPRPFSPPVQLLLRLGAYVDPQDVRGASPLLIAVMNKTSNPEHLIPPLLRWGADVDLQDKSGLSPALAVISTYRTRPRMQYCRLVLQRSQDLNVITKIHNQDYTPLLYAIETRNILAIRLLLELGANLNIGVEQDGIHYLPLLAATVARDPEQPEMLATLLQEVGASPDTWIGSSCTLLHICAAIGHNKCAQTLLDVEANMNMLDANGSTPLQIAIKNGNFNLAKTLLARGADVNVGTNLMLGTPLHLALKDYNEDLLFAILRADADPTVKDYRMNTPLNMLQGLVRKVIHPQQVEPRSPQSSAAEHEITTGEDHDNEIAMEDTLLVADPSNLPSYNRVRSLMLEKIADRDAKRFGWPLMGEEGWYQAQLLSRMQTAPGTPNRSGPRFRDVRSRYIRHPLQPLTVEST